MQSSTTMKLFLIVGVFALSLYLLYPTYNLSIMSDAEKEALEKEDRNVIIDLKSKSVNLGLDLQGGMHLVLQVVIFYLLCPAGKRPAENILHKGVEEGETIVGADTVTAGHLHGNPAFHPLALDNDDFRLQRRQRRA